MSGGGKTSQQSSTVELPEEIRRAAIENQALAKRVAGLPYAPNFGATVAAFTPQQNAAFSGANSAASAFGLPTGGAPTMPQPGNFGGYAGYSTEGLYNDMLSRMDPATRAKYEQFFAGTAQPSAQPTAKPQLARGFGFSAPGQTVDLRALGFGLGD